MAAIATAEPNAVVSTSTIESSIPKTNDQGDALYAACQILTASYDYCCSAGDNKVPQAVRMIVKNAVSLIGRQYAEWLKGGNS